MNLSLLVVDDEPLARRKLRALLKQTKPEATIETAKHGEEALQKIQQKTYHVVFLDIRMPGIDGLAVHDQLKEMKTPPAIIYTTAYREYAVNAFYFPAVAYLLKPIEQDTLANAIKAMEDNQKTIHQLQKETTTLVLDNITGTSKQVTRINLTDIIAFQAEEKNTWVYTEENKFPSSYSLKHIEDTYGHAFIRIHRNCLVHRTRIRSLEINNQQHILHLHGRNETFPISRQQWPTIKDYFLQYDK